MKNLFLTLLFLLCLPALVMGQSPRATRNLEKLTFDSTNQLKTVSTGAAADGKILDGTAAGQADVVGSNPTGTEQGVVTRNIPSGTQPISASSLPLPVGAATSAGQLADGHNVTVDNAASAPVPIQASDGTIFIPPAILELGITELIGANEQVTASQYSASVAVTLAGTGTIKKICLIATEDDAGGGGVVFTPAGDLMLFKSDPAIASDDATITNAERLTIIAVMTFAAAAADWQSDANGAINCQDTTEVYSDATLFATWHSASGEVMWNSLAADDEQLEFNVLYERKS